MKEASGSPVALSDWQRTLAGFNVLGQLTSKANEYAWPSNGKCWHRRQKLEVPGIDLSAVTQ